jgi:hypothetical protein
MTREKLQVNKKKYIDKNHAIPIKFIQSTNVKYFGKKYKTKMYRLGNINIKRY